MHYLVIKNHINVFCKDIEDVHAALASLKSAKGVRAFKVEEIELGEQPVVVPVMKEG